MADILVALRGDSPIRSCRHLVPESFGVNRVGQLKIGQSFLISEVGTPAEIVIENTPIFHLLVVYQGSLALESATGELSLGEGDVALVPPGPRTARSSHFSLASIALRPQALAAAAAAMAGTPRNGARPSSSIGCCAPLMHPSPWDGRWRPIWPWMMCSTGRPPPSCIPNCSGRSPPTCCVTGMGEPPAISTS